MIRYHHDIDFNRITQPFCPHITVVTLSSGSQKLLDPLRNTTTESKPPLNSATVQRRSRAADHEVLWE